ncbi:hypothetical protein [Streptomyces sp. NPDC059906]|uniref:hypothetical protein n=1 Tax=Streptomyces sp. NPDC059906 TaxID=3346997 RepID=UPI003658B489
MKGEPNQCDAEARVYGIGENGDCSVDALLCDNTADLVHAFRQWPTAKVSFATKFVNPDLLALDPRGRRLPEVIMLKHNRGLYEVNLGRHPRAEEALWRPEVQQAERSENGALNVRYRADVKAGAVARLRALVAAHAPWLRIRYAF